MTLRPPTWALALLSLSMLYACQAFKHIDQTGFRSLALGDPMPEPGMGTYKGYPARDTLIREGGYEWRALIISCKVGEIWVESDFYQQGTINRIRVTSPQTDFKGQIQVGMAVADLTRLTRQWRFYYMAAYQVWDAHSELYPSIHFLIQAPPPGQEEPVTDLSGIPLESRISGIVVM